MKASFEIPKNWSGSLDGEAAEWLLLWVPGLIWGASFLFIAEAMRSVAPNGLVFLRILVGFLTLALFPAARKPLPRSDWLAVAALGIFWLAFPLTMFPFAEQRVSSGLTGMLNAANPLFTAIVAAAVARRVPSPRIRAGIAVGMIGAVLMAFPAIREGHSSAAGVTMILAALISYGAALNIARPLQQRNGALPVLWRAQWIALLLTAPMGLPDVLRARWQPGPLLSLFALGVFGTGIAHVVMSVAAGKLGATRASATTFLIPIVAVVLGTAVRGERLAALTVAGSVVCIGGAWLMRRAQSSQNHTPMLRQSSIPSVAKAETLSVFRTQTSPVSERA